MKCDNIDKIIDYAIPYTPTPDGVYFTQEYAHYIETLIFKEKSRVFNVQFAHRGDNKTGFTIIQVLAPNTAVYTINVLDAICQQMSKFEFADAFIDLLWRTYKNDIYRQSTKF